MSRIHAAPAAPVLLMAAAIGLAAPAPAEPPGPEESGGGRARPSNALNPAISANALGLATWRRSDTREEPVPDDPGHGFATGLTLQEAELVFSASVDPYFKADLIVALADAGPEEEGFETDLEEAYVTALRMPRGLGLRAGKILQAFGRHNVLHTHAFPFISAPLALEQAFGDEGLNEPGAEVSYLLPMPWFSQAVVAVTDGRNEMFGSPRPQDLAWLGRFRNLWDLDESSTLEVGVSGLWGRRGEDGESDGSARTWGADVTWKHRPVRRATERALEIQAEILRRDLDALGEAGEESLTGGYVHARWQVRRRWWLEGRYDRVETEIAGVGADEDRWTALVAFLPSEFSALRLEYATLSPYEGPRDHQVRLQLGWSIGPHPAHSY